MWTRCIVLVLNLAVRILSTRIKGYKGMSVDSAVDTHMRRPTHIHTYARYIHMYIIYVNTDITNIYIHTYIH